MSRKDTRTHTFTCDFVGCDKSVTVDVAKRACVPRAPGGWVTFGIIKDPSKNMDDFSDLCEEHARIVLKDVKTFPHLRDE